MHKKKCFKCGEEKLIKEFYSHPQMKDKHLNKCKSCCKKYEKLERIVHFEKKRIYEKARKRIAYLSKKSKEWREKNPIKYKAHNIINNALRDKKIIKPKRCEICDSSFSISAHHYDYSKPLEVVWICARCHVQIHSKS